MRSIASHPAGLHGRLAKNGNRAPNAGDRIDKYAQGLPYHCNNSTACILCLLELMLLLLKWWIPREELVAKQVLEKDWYEEFMKSQVWLLHPQPVLPDCKSHRM